MESARLAGTRASRRRTGARREASGGRARPAALVSARTAPSATRARSACGNQRCGPCPPAGGPSSSSSAGDTRAFSLWQPTLPAGPARRRPRRRLLFVLLALLATPLQAAWLKGNLHTHTSESDGDSSPAVVAKWYAEHGYDFLVITDHDKITTLPDAPLLLIPGEEVTDRLPKRPLHVNAIGLTRVVKPQGGTTAVEVLQRNIDAVREAGGLALVNHPNFGWAFGAEELLQLKGATMLEVASSHPFVNDIGPPSVESMWDQLLTAGKRVWAAAVDDMHHLARPLDEDSVPPGGAWVCVRAEKREAKAILAALERGDFYASTGPVLEEYAVTEKALAVRVAEKWGARYRVQFIGSGGKVLQETQGPSAAYAIAGDEGYVRAKVIDSNGNAAWLQPLFVSAK
ncbi:MAG TPA: CehA/McbA family metallohydrolase [Thermoanaerobaculia bacterium]